MDPVVRSRVLPRISFRSMLAFTTVGAIVAATARAAGDGGVLAKAVVVGLLVLATFFVLFAIAFLLALASAKLIHGKFDNAREGNPFAQDQLPPQQLKPREVEK